MVVTNNLADLFKSLRLGKDYTDSYGAVPIDNDLQANIKKIEQDNVNLNKSISKSLYGNQQAYAEPFLSLMDTNPEFRDKRSYTKNEHNLHDVLKKFGNKCNYTY